MATIKTAVKKPREYQEPEVDMSMPVAQAFQTKLTELDMKMSRQMKEVNNTLLALATHMEGLQSPTPMLPPMEEKKWNPRKSDMLLWDKDSKGISWWNHYKGAKIFLVCSGPSLNDLDLSLLDNRGVMTMAMNNSWCMVKPDIWIGFDTPGRFHNQGWMDPSIMKIVPWHRKEHRLNHRVGGEIVDMGIKAQDAPNCWFLSNNTTFNPETWFTEKSANWGGGVKGIEPEGGFRVTMFGALRTLYYLGFQEVYLLGCDWEMPNDMNKGAYAWDELREPIVRDKNNDMYRWIGEVLEKLKPEFDRSGFQIYNCKEDSKLELFPFMSYEEAIQRATVPELEDTHGWYSIPNKQ